MTNKQKPVKTIKDKDAGAGRETVRQEHPAFGVVQVSRSQTIGATLFGSAVEHRNMISVTVSRAVLDRHLNHDHIHATEDIVRFSLSPAQWAQFVSSMGQGSGTPITLDRAPEKGTRILSMPVIDGENARDTFREEIEKAMEGVNQDVLEAQTMIAKSLKPGGKPLSKTELKELHGKLLHAGTHFRSNMGFIQESFAEVMEKTVEAAKSDVEAFVASVATSTGLEVLRERQADVALLADQRKIGN